MALSRDEIRLECLKLAVTRFSDHNEALKRAEHYYQLVVEPPPPEPKPEIKKTGNIRSLT